MTTLPPLLDRRDLPEPVLRAAVLDGELVPLGEGFAPVDLPIEAGTRARSLACLALGSRVVAGLTAAWVWGAAFDPGRPYLALQPSGSAAAHPPSHDEGGVRTRTAALRAGDVAMLAGVRVTSVLRTVIDLLRDTEPCDDDVIRRLLDIGGLDATRVAAELSERPRLPGRIVALQRVQALFTR